MSMAHSKATGPAGPEVAIAVALARRAEASGGPYSFCMFDDMAQQPDLVVDFVQMPVPPGRSQRTGSGRLVR